ncbi:MAG TPA: PIN domain-containing protein [Casimicrobiaceae bacterium]
MIAYVDSSVLLRVILGQRDALKEWGRISQGITSALAEVECLRTLDRLRLTQGYADEVIAERREAVYRLMESIEVVEITYPILARASQPLPTALGTLDALHLATALLWKERAGKGLSMATHDTALAVAARASGLPVVGV